MVKSHFLLKPLLTGECVCVFMRVCLYFWYPNRTVKPTLKHHLFFLQKCTNHICTSQNEISLCLLKGKGVTSGNWLIQGRVGRGVCGGGGADKVPGMNSLSGEVAILPLSGIIIIFIIITTQTPLFCGSGEAKIIGFFPTNNTFTPELN